jgi:colanic acid/amylovoran biosynthesis protein
MGFGLYDRRPYAAPGKSPALNAPRLILIVNTHSVLNSGDAAIVLAQVRWLRTAFPGARFSLTSRTAKADKSLYEPLGIRVIPAVYDVPSLFTGGPEKLARSLASLVRVRAKTDLVREMGRADLVIGSGGGYFYSNRSVGPGPMFLQNLFHLKLACWMKKPVILFPQSFGPTFDPRSKRLLANLVSDPSVKRVLVREENSLRFLAGILGKGFDDGRYFLCPDAAFLLAPEEETAKTSGREQVLPRPVTAVTVRPWNFPELPSTAEREIRRREYFAGLEDTAVRIQQKWGGTVLLFPQSRGPGDFENDRPASLRLYRALQKRIPSGRLAWIDFPDAVAPASIQKLCAQADLLLATRFHSAILALCGGTPVVSLNYQPKSAGMMRMLGLERYAVDIAEARPDVLIPLADGILERGEAFRAEVLGLAERMKERAEAVFREALTGAGFLQP